MKYSHHLQKYILHKQMNPKSFAESLGLNRPDRLYNVLSGKNGLSSKFANLITSRYKDVSYDWLLTGEGEMIAMKGKDPFGNFGSDETGNIVPLTDSKNKIGYMVSDDKTVYPVKDGVTQMDDGLHMVVEFRDLSVAAGPLTRTENGHMPKKTMLVPKEYDKGEYLVVRVDGPSMEDGSFYSIPNGANILIRRYHLEKGERLPIRGNLFVIDSKDGQALKQIIEHNVEEGYIICHSYNPEFNDYKVPMEDVLGFYLYRKIVGFRPPVRDIN